MRQTIHMLWAERQCWKRGRLSLASWGLLIALTLVLLLSGCNAGGETGDASQVRTFLSETLKPITYNTNPRTVLIRTYYGGGLYGTLTLYPNISVYGDGTYILEGGRQGKLTTEQFQKLLSALADTYALPTLKRRIFREIPDQNATYLELLIDGKQHEMVYGSFGHIQESAQDLDEYRRLGNALTTLTEALNGKTHPYREQQAALLVRQTFSPDFTHDIQKWFLSDFTLAQAAAYECGLIPEDETSSNAETACLKYTIPQKAILLNATQQQILRNQIQGNQATFIERGVYYSVELRPLLPDEPTRKSLAMFGSAQDSVRRVDLLQGTVPPVPTPIP